MTILITTGAVAAGSSLSPANAKDTKFGPSNPFYGPSSLPFHAPPFDKIKDEDYQPAIEAGMAQEHRRNSNDRRQSGGADVRKHTRGDGEDRATVEARVRGIQRGDAERTPIQYCRRFSAEEAPKLAAHHDAIYLNPKLFARVSAVYNERDSLKLDPESLRLVEYHYHEFVHSGANLSDADKAELKKLNEEESTLSNTLHRPSCWRRPRMGAYVTTDKSALAGLSDAQIAAAAAGREGAQGGGLGAAVAEHDAAAGSRVAAAIARRGKAMFENSWTRAERGDANDTRATIARLAQLRARRRKLLGFPNYAAWKLQDQMAKTPEAALEVHGCAGAGVRPRKRRAKARTSRR